MHTAIVDVRERTPVWKAIEEGVTELGRLDVVVANAGIAAMGKGRPSSRGRTPSTPILWACST